MPWIAPTNSVFAFNATDQPSHRQPFHPKRFRMAVSSYLPAAFGITYTYAVAFPLLEKRRPSNNRVAVMDGPPTLPLEERKLKVCVIFSNHLWLEKQVQLSNSRAVS